MVFTYFVSLLALVATGPLSYVAAAGGGVLILTPDMYTAWSLGTKQNITWVYGPVSDPDPAQVNIDLFNNDVRQRLVTVPAMSYKTEIVVPETTETGEYKIQFTGLPSGNWTTSTFIII